MTWRILPLVFLALSPPVLACTPWIEDHNSGAILRPHTDAFTACTIDEVTYQRLVADWLSAHASDAEQPMTLGLGRAVNYPWLSQHMADTALAKPTHLSGSQMAAQVLLDPALLHRLAVPFANSPFALAKLSYEKVLFGSADRVASSPHAGARKVPFDAQLWLHLQARH
ncbi:MAG: hypothetical protein IPH08_18340 [Rhodocyclaceae bacterium]|jgi:hypothetical protein|nr:hypothetical protein [Rhodocyclaceae bacterium]MBK6908959.1 hypothetical protein [Rhodocyclaceae bacterium]